MTYRDLTPNQADTMVKECERTFTEWFDRTEGLTFGTRIPVGTHEVWRLAFSKGVATVLRQIQKLK